MTAQSDTSANRNAAPLRRAEGGDGHGASAVIDFMRFPLALAVVAIHSRTGAVFAGESVARTSPDFPFADIVVYAVSEVVARVAVPVFFLVSGYLFFSGMERWDWGLYLSKLKRRSGTLLLPYIFWNALVFACYYALEPLFPELRSGCARPLHDYDFGEFLMAFWKGPIDYPLWFVRNLMVMSVASPFAYLFARYAGRTGIVLLAAVFVFVPDSGLSFLDDGTLLFFAAGAYIGVSGGNPVSAFAGRDGCLFAAYALLAILSVAMMNSPYGTQVCRASILFGVPALFRLVSRLTESGRVRMHPFLGASSFFIFAAHGQLIVFINKVLFYCFRPSSQMALLSCYLVQIVLAVAVSLAAFALLRRFLPRFTAAITGGRY